MTASTTARPPSMRATAEPPDEDGCRSASPPSASPTDAGSGVRSRWNVDAGAVVVAAVFVAGEAATAAGTQARATAATRAAVPRRRGGRRSSTSLGVIGIRLRPLRGEAGYAG